MIFHHHQGQAQLGRIHLFSNPIHQLLFYQIPVWPSHPPTSASKIPLCLAPRCLQPTPNIHMWSAQCQTPSTDTPDKASQQSPLIFHHPYKQEFLLFMILLTFISTGPKSYRRGVSYFSPNSKILLFAYTVNSSCQSYTFSPDQTPLFLPIFPLESSYSDPHRLFHFFYIFHQVQCPMQALVLQQCQSTRRPQHWTQSPFPCLWKQVSAAVGAGWCWKSNVWPTKTPQHCSVEALQPPLSILYSQPIHQRQRQAHTKAFWWEWWTLQGHLLVLSKATWKSSNFLPPSTCNIP